MADVVKAVMNLYESIPAAAFPGSSRPGIYLDAAPQTTAAGAQLRVPYVVLRDRGRQPEFFMSHGGIEAGTLVVEVYHTDLGTADLIAKAAKYGAGTPGQRQGLDFGTLTLTTPLSAVSLKRVGERRAFSGVDKDGKNVYMVELTYRVVVGLSA